MNVPINIPIIGKEERKIVDLVLRTGFLSSASNQGGKYVQEFEKLVSTYTKSKFVTSTNSGTSALQASLFASDVKNGDEVLIPSFTFVATANAVISLGAKPVFVDILKENFTMDPIDLQKKISKKSKAIIPVHIFGNIAHIEQILKISKKHKIKIIEDAAQSLGSTLKGKHSGTFGDFGCYSMYPAKVITSGEGGFVVTNNKKSFEKLKMFRNHGMVHGYDSKIFGLNLRLPEINAAIAKIQIKKLPNFLRLRRKNAKILSELLSDLDISLPIERTNEKVNWYLYTIATKKRNKILKKLHAKGIGATVYYPIPVHKLPSFKNKIKLPNTDWATSHVLSLPIHPKVSQKSLFTMAKIIREELH